MIEIKGIIKGNQVQDSDWIVLLGIAFQKLSLIKYILYF